MHPMLKRTLYWAPRILTLLFALFLSMFAFDVFTEGYSLGEALVGLFIHLVPTYLVVIGLIVAWKWEWFGALLYFVLGGLYIYLAWGKEMGGAMLIISGPLFLIAILFLINWRWHGQLRPEH